MFSPLVASGQRVALNLYLEAFEGDDELRFAPYVRRAHSNKIDQIGTWQTPSNNNWMHVEFVIPDAGGEAVDEIGLLLEYFGEQKYSADLFLANFQVSGAGHTRIDPAMAHQEWGAITRFTHNRGQWSLENGKIVGVSNSDADLWTGHAYMRDTIFNVEITPQAGTSHLLTSRAQGTSRCP